MFSAIMVHGGSCVHRGFPRLAPLWACAGRRDRTLAQPIGGGQPAGVSTRKVCKRARIGSGMSIEERFSRLK